MAVDERKGGREIIVLSASSKFCPQFTSLRAD
jgi:hypothetical protein